METLRVELDARYDLAPVEHVLRIEPVSSDCYLVCSCGWVSQPYVSDTEARADMRHRCPRDVVERGTLINRAKLRERLAEMTA